MQIRLRRLWILLIGALLVGLVSVTTTAVLAAEKSIVWEEFNADITVNQDGTFDVAEEQAIRFFDGTFSFGYRNIPKANLGEITDWAIVDASGNTYRQAPGGKEPYTFVVQDVGDEYVVNWYFPPRSDPETYTLYYRVHDGLRYYPDGDQVWWKAVYGDRSFPVQSSQVRVLLPPGAQVDNYAAYINGDDAAGQVTGQILNDGRTALFQTQNWLQAGEELEVRVQFPHGVVAGAAPFWQQAADDEAARAAAERAQRERIAPWFDLGFGTLGIILVIVGPLLVYLLWYHYGRDKPVRQVADYLPEPPDPLQPGLVGILLDDSADMQDVLATLVDLARRKAISITEERKEGFWSTNSDFIYRREDRDVPLAAFERKLLDDVFGSSDQKRLSDLKNKFYSKLPGIKEAMYADIIGLGYYRSNPERIRTTFGILGSVAIVIAIVFGVYALHLRRPCLRGRHLSGNRPLRDCRGADRHCTLYAAQDGERLRRSGALACLQGISAQHRKVYEPGRAEDHLGSLPAFCDRVRDRQGLHYQIPGGGRAGARLVHPLTRSVRPVPSPLLRSRTGNPGRWNGWRRLSQ